MRRFNEEAEYVMKDLAPRIGISPYIVSSTRANGGCVFLLHNFSRIFFLFKFFKFINYWLETWSLEILVIGECCTSCWI